KALIKCDTGLSLRVALGVLDNLSELGEQGPGDDPPQDSEPNFEEWNALAGPLRTDFKAAAASGVAKETLDRARELYEESKALAKAEQFEAAIAKLHDFEAALDRLAPPTELNAAAWKARVLRVKKRLLKFPRADPAFRPLERLYHRAVAEGNAGNRQASDATLERLERELALASEAPPVAARQAPGEPRPNKAVRVQGEVSRLLAEIADRTSSSEQGDAAERIRASLTAVARYLKISPAMRIEKLREAVAKAYLAAQEALQGDDHALAEAGMQRALEAMEHAEAEQKEAQRAWDSLDDLRNQTEAGVAELEKMDDFAAPKFRYVLRHSLREGSRGDFVDAKKRLTDLAAQVAKAVADKDARAIWTARLDDESLATDALQDFEALNQRIVDAAVPGLGRIVEVDDLVELRQTLREALEQERWQPSSDVLDELIAAVNRVRQTATDRTALLELAATDKRDTAIYEPLFQLAAETTSPPDDEDDERWKAYLGANEAFGQAREALTLARANFVNDPYELSNAWTDAIRTAEAVLRARKKFYGKDSQDAARLEYEQRVGELDAPKLRKALETPNFTRETRTAKQRLTRLTEEAATHARAGEYKAALAILNRLDEAVGEVKLAARYASYDSRHVEAFWSEGASKRAIVEKAQISPETHGDAARLKGIYDAAESAFDQAWSEDKFAECLGELGEAMSVALDAVVQSLAAQVAREAEALQEEVDQLKTPDEAQNFINAAGDRLREFPAQVQISLLKILRAEGLEGPGKAAARNTVYRAMKLDAAFLKEDEAARSKCVEAVAKMKEVAEAQANWN
ncbi:MAG TPA: hypothetical protein VGE52_19835, partial [Pirellulales bacterium]